MICAKTNGKYFCPYGKYSNMNNLTVTNYALAENSTKYTPKPTKL